MSNTRLVINAAFVRRKNRKRFDKELVKGIRVDGLAWTRDNYPAIQAALGAHRPGPGWTLAAYHLAKTTTTTDES